MGRGGGMREEDGFELLAQLTALHWERERLLSIPKEGTGVTARIGEVTWIEGASCGSPALQPFAGMVPSCSALGLGWTEEL